MYKENYEFHTPNKETKVWRYIDFTKFVDLITSSKLFFCRSDYFEDPFEGVFRFKYGSGDHEIFNSQELTKKFYFLNCWHINDNQSDAMWKIFLNTNNGIAIKSTVGGIINSLKESKDDIHIGKVYYRDFDKVTFKDLMFEEQNRLPSGKGGSVNQFNYKRISFEHEKELRLFYIDMPIPHITKDGVEREPLEERYVDVDLKLLIDEIVIAPFGDEWFKEMIERLLDKLELNFKTSKSDLYKLE